MLINLKLYAICGAVIITLVSCSYLYLSYRIEKAVNEKYAAKIEQLKVEQLQNLQQLQHEQNVIDTGYINDIERLKEQHEKTLRSLKMRTLKILLSLSLLLMSACARQIEVKQVCRQPELNPILSVIPEANFSQRLKEVWIWPQNVTKTQRDTGH